MDLYIQVTFDLIDRQTSDYPKFESWLSGQGPKKVLVFPDRVEFKLPANTFACFTDRYSDEAEAAKYIKQALRNASFSALREARAFVSICAASAMKSEVYGIVPGDNFLPEK